MAKKVLFIGGTGVISSACSALAVEQGFDLYLLNRRRSPRPAPPQARMIRGDIHDPQELPDELTHQAFDVVVDWIAYTPQDVQRDIGWFNGRVGQYIFISSASAYQKPVQSWPITEATPLENPFWEYSRNKIACEKVLMEAYERSTFPVTVVRPSHTYDRTLLPTPGGYTMLGRMRQGLPVVIHGDGSSLWVLTHQRDFALGFMGLVGNAAATGEAFQITSDELLSWSRIYQLLAEAAGAELRPVFVPSTVIARYDAEWGAGLLGDKAHSVIFDNTKIKRLVPEFTAQIPFAEGCREIVAWYDEDPSRQVVDERFWRLVDRLVADFG